MADPREVTPQNRRDPRSDLLKAQSRAMQGEKVNVCPFECKDHELDEHGYCRHLIGFTNDQKTYEPMVKVKGGRRVVRVPMKATGEVVTDERIDEDGTAVPTRTEVTAPVLPLIVKGDQLVRISTSYRVYRDVKVKQPA